MTDDPTTRGQQVSALAEKLRQLSGDYPAGRFSGRGIVIAAGGSIMFTNAYVLISVLRQTLGCMLPIEVWHFGAAEMSPTMARLLAELDAKPVDALPHIAAAGVDIKDGWQLKPFCLQHCSFEEVLLLDADQVPVTDPSVVFEWPPYRQSGAVFWPDVVGIRADNPVWKAMGVSPQQPEISFESGQIVVDKRRHWRALSIAVGLNAAAELIYRYLYGDKDTFLLAFRLATEDFSLVPHLPFQDSHWLAQRDFAGKVLFQHLTNRKWAYAADAQAPEGIELFEACVAALSQLRERWNGRVFNAPDRSAAARASEAELVAIHIFRLEVVGDEQDEIELKEFGEIGKGRSGFRQNWWCEADANSVRLLIRDVDRVTYRLTRQDDGTWQGPRYTFIASQASLAPMVAGAPAIESRSGLADELLRAAGFPRQSAEDWAGFHAALKLIAKIDVGVMVRLRAIADSLEPKEREMLLRLVDELAPQHAPGSRTEADLEVLRTGYRSRLDLTHE